MIEYKFCTLVLFLYFTCQVRSRYMHTFHCKNGEYLSEGLFCSKFSFCRDNSDLSYGCNRTKCGGGKFTCKDGTCVNVSNICNTIKNCPDGSDEENCGENVILNNCTTRNGKFLCKDNLRCLELEYTCDGECNCFDCSDENDNCLKYDDNLQRRCPHGYFSTVDGPQCYCDSSNSEYAAICKEITSCDVYQLCGEQKCIRYKAKQQCICKEDHHIVSGGIHQSCKSYGLYKGILFYVNDSNVVSLNMTSKEISLVQEIINCTSMTVAHSHLYMAQFLLGKGRIFKKALNSDISDTLVEIDTPITSISVDYITKNLYFTTNKSLSVCTNDGRICTQLKCCNVKNVVVAPRFGLMFYCQEFTSLNDIIIKKSNLDGSEESVVKDEIFHYEIIIAIDETSETLYFAEQSGREMIYGYIKFNGKDWWNDRRGMLKYQSSISVFENKIFFLLENRNIIRVRDGPDGGIGVLYFQDNQSISIKHLHVYNPFRERFNMTESPCLKAVCNGICLSRPEKSPGSGLGYKCIDELRPLIENATEEEEEEYYLEEEELLHSASSNTILVIFLLTVIFVLLLIGGYFVIREFNLTQYCVTRR